MKQNAEEAAALIKRAISLTGSDFALSEARSFLYAAVNSLAKAHKKRERRENNYKENERISLISRQEAERRIAYLNQMLREEQLKRQTGSDQSGTP